MARAKRGMHVWQCNQCSYWSERKRNVERHNNSIHKGNAFVVQAYAALVTEPSYKVAPVVIEENDDGHHSFVNNSSLSLQRPAIAFDTRKSSKPAFCSSRVGGTVSKTYKEDTLEDKICRDIRFQKIEVRNRKKIFKEIIELREETIDLYNTIQKAMGNTTPQASPLMWWQPIPGTSSLHTPLISSNCSGFKGGICDRCFSAFVTPIPANVEHPEAFKFMIPLESHHQCHEGRGKKFESEQARLDEKVKIEYVLTDMLISHVKAWMQGKKIVLVAKKLNYVPASPLGSLFRYKQSSEDLISRVVKAGMIEINDQELREFLQYTRSTAEIFFAIDEQSPTTTNYSISVQGQAIKTEVDKIMECLVNNIFSQLETSLNQEIEKELADRNDDNNSSMKYIFNSNAEKEETAVALPLSPSPSSSILQLPISQEEFIGIKSIVCDKCLNAYLSPLLKHPDSSLESIFHRCTQQHPKFPSEQTRKVRKEQANKDAIDKLFQAIKGPHSEGKIALAAVSTNTQDFGLKGPSIEYNNNLIDPVHYIFRAIKEKVTSVNNTELYDFFSKTHSTHGLFKIAKTEGGYDYYTLFVHDSVKEDNTTLSPALASK